MVNNKVRFHIINHIPKYFLSRFMRIIVTKYYNCNEYNEVYRTKNELTTFESSVINEYCSQLPSDKPHVFDIGCGAGIPFDTYFVNKGCKITGIDISKSQINKARINLPLENFIIADIMSYRDEALYDGIVLLYSLFHIQREYHHKLMKKIYNLLTPGGKVLLNIRKEDSGRVKYRHEFCGKPMCWSHYDCNRFLDIVTNIGFSYQIIGDEKSFGSFESHLWVILSKSN